MGASRQVQLSQQQQTQQQQQNQASRQVQLSQQQQTQQQQQQLNQQQLNQGTRQIQLNQANTQNQFNQQQQNQQARVTLTNQQNNQQNQQVRVTLTNQQNDQQNQQARVTLTNQQNNQQAQRIQTNERQEASVAGQSAQLQNAQAFNLQQSNIQFRPNILFRSSAEGGLVEEIRFDEDQAISGVFEPLNLPSGASAILGNIDTSFSCYDKPYGYYADRDNNCNLFHVCNPTLFSDGSIETYQYSFMCGEGTVFDQKELTCKVPVDAISCQESPSYFYVNEYFGIIGEL